MNSCAWCGIPINAKRSTRKFCSPRCKQASHRNDKELKIEANMKTLPLGEYHRISFWRELGDMETVEKLSEVFAEFGLDAFIHWSNALQWNHAVTMNAAMAVIAASLDTPKPDDTIH